MRIALLILAWLGLTTGMAPAQGSSAELGPRIRVVDSIPAPESVAIGPDGAWYVSSFGRFGVPGDGAVYRIDPSRGTRKVFAAGLDDPCGLLFLGDTLWVADRTGVFRVTAGNVELIYPARGFHRELHFLNDLAAGPRGTLYVSDTGDSTVSGGGAVFLLTQGTPAVLVPGSDTARAQSSANGLFPGAGDSLFVVGYRTGVLGNRWPGWVAGDRPGPGLARWHRPSRRRSVLCQRQRRRVPLPGSTRCPRASAAPPLGAEGSGRSGGGPLPATAADSGKLRKSAQCLPAGPPPTR